MSTINENSKSVLGIRGRLLLGFFAISAILMCAVTATLIVVTSSEKTAHYVVNVDLPAYEKILDLGGQIYLSQSEFRGYYISHDEKFKAESNRAQNNIDKLVIEIDNLAKAWNSQSSIQTWNEIKSLVSNLKEKQQKLETLLSLDNQNKDLMQLFTDTVTVENKIITLLDGKLTESADRAGGFYDTLLNKLQTGTTNITTDLNTIRKIEFALMLIIVVTSTFIALFTAKVILTPIKNAIDIAKKIASGKRDTNINIKSNDETGELLSALKSMQESITDNEDKLRQNEEKTRQLLENILLTAKSYSTHSSRVASGDLTQYLHVDKEDVMTQLGEDLNTMTGSLSSITKQITQACHNMVVTMDEVKRSVDVQSTGASEQASSINQITASIEEIEKSSTQTMDKAKNLGESAERTREKGQLGLAAVEQSIQGMKLVRDQVQVIAQTILGLSEQTQQVGEITTAVNTLAQQLKMLALNASIEAAKAGEAGKGFSVVAVEVKNLAEQSEQSTVQVQKILENIRHAAEKAVMVTEEGTKGVDHGTNLVEQTGDIVKDLSTVIHETSIATQQIEASIRQESVGIEQITAGMNEINQVTSSFVESTKQTMEAITNLADVAKKLKENIDFYKIKDTL
jgi:methyl-accepting chemotaxis protein